jgi:hypothetical protein
VLGDNTKGSFLAVMVNRGAVWGCARVIVGAQGGKEHRVESGFSNCKGFRG